ncbi:MAG: FUSC family protein [Kofleriaceae bacterium]|nr:FUSC family protein [Kofleriaceae bacterium]
MSAHHLMLLRLAASLRVAIATVVPFYLAIVLAEPVLAWASLGGWLGSLADPGGRGWQRVVAVGVFAVGGGLTITLGILSAPHPSVAACVLATVTFGATLARARIPLAASVGTVLAITSAIATSVMRTDTPVTAGALFALGAAWPLLFSSLVWGGAPTPRLDPGPQVPREAVLHHALCVAIAALCAFVLGNVLSPDHASWVTVTTVAVMQPYPTATLERAVERMLGTVVGCTVVIAIMRFVHAPLAIALVMFSLTAAATLARPRSYRMFVAFLTPVFVLVASRLYADWGSVALRVFDVVLGGLLAVVATLVEHKLRTRT